MKKIIALILISFVCQSQTLIKYKQMENPATTSVNLGTNNINTNNAVNGVQSVTSINGTTTLTLASPHLLRLTGSASQTIQLPNATTLPLNISYELNNNSLGNLVVVNAGGSIQTTIPSGGVGLISCQNNSTSNGTWEFHFLLPSNAVFGTSGLAITGTLSASNLTTYNVLNYGLVGDGSTDDRAALNTLLNTTAPSGSTIYFPRTSASYSLGSGISVANKYFYFVSDFATINVGGNFSAFTFSSSSNTTLLGARNSFNNLRFLGTSSGSSQCAITFSTDASEFTVSNCTFENIAGNAINLYVTNSPNGAGGLITANKFISCGTGAKGGLVAEYVNVQNNYFLSCSQAISSTAGNWKILGNNINRCSQGILFAAGSNDGHGIIANNDINHSGNALDISGLILGMTISDNHIYGSNISIKTSTGVVISGGKIDASTFTFSNNIGLVFNDVTFVGTTGNVSLTGTAPVYNNCKNDAGLLMTCPASSCALTGQIRVPKFALNSSSTLQTYAASTSYYISPLYSTVGSRSIVNQIPYCAGVKCKLIGYSINTNSNSNPSQENSTVYVRINNTTDLTLNSTVKFNATAWTTNSYSDMTLNTDFSATDKWEIKISTGAFVTAPTSGFMAVTLYFTQDF